MKKSMYTFGILALMMVGTACNNSDNGDPQGNEFPDGIQPVVLADELGDELTAFFKEYLPESSSSVPPIEFNFGENIDQHITVCLLINSMDEFKAIAPPVAELPSIDFEKYTLIIGQHELGNPGYRLEKQSMDTEPDEMKLSLLYQSLGGGNSATMTTFYYWGLYPKLPQKPVIVNVIK